MTCEELLPEYQAYALGIAEDPERIEIAQHIARNCPNCIPDVRQAMEVVAAMSNAVPIADPPRHLRERVAAMVSPNPAGRKRMAFLPWVIAAALAITLLFVTVPGRERSESSNLDQVLSILRDPATKDVAFGQVSARGRVFVSPDRGVVFVAAGLPPLQPGRTFELWVIPAAGKPIPAGTFRSEANAAVHVWPGPVSNTAAVAVTVEPEGGSAQPTTTPFIVAKL